MRPRVEAAPRSAGGVAGLRADRRTAASSSRSSRALALWGLRSIDPPTEDADLAPGWLYGALDTVFAAAAPSGSFEFRIGGEVAAIVDGEARQGSIENPDVVLEAPVSSFYWLVVERRWDGVNVEGDRVLLERLLDTATGPAQPVSVLA